MLGYTVRGIVDAMKLAKINPNQKFFFSSYGYGTKTSNQYIKWFRDCLHEEISSHENRQGRKFTMDYQVKLIQDFNNIQKYLVMRIRNTGCRNLLNTKEMKRRYPFINNQIDE